MRSTDTTARQRTRCSRANGSMPQPRPRPSQDDAQALRPAQIRLFAGNSGAEPTPETPRREAATTPDRIIAPQSQRSAKRDDETLLSPVKPGLTFDFLNLLRQEADDERRRQSMTNSQKPATRQFSRLKHAFISVVSETLLRLEPQRRPQSCVEDPAPDSSRRHYVQRRLRNAAGVPRPASPYCRAPHPCRRPAGRSALSARNTGA